MQSSASLSSIASSTSSNSSTYGSRTVLDVKDLHLAAPRCRSSIVAFLDNDQTLFSPPSSPPPPPPPRRRRSHLPSTNNKSMSKCRHLLRTCLSSAPSPLALPVQAKLSSAVIRQQYFAKLCRSHRLLLALNDYDCQCGCHFSMRQGDFVILYETNNDSTPVKDHRLITVISNELVCSKIPSNYVCDVNLLRDRVRARRQHSDDEQSFDL